MSQIDYIDEESIKEFKKLGVVGDIDAQFFDANGQVVDHPINRTVMGIGLDELNQIPNVLLIGFGDNKLEAIKVARAHKLVNNIVTKDNIAKALLGDDGK